MKIFIIGLGKLGRTLLNAYLTVDNVNLYIYDRDKTKVSNIVDNKRVFPVYNINEISDVDTIFITVIDKTILNTMDKLNESFKGDIVIMSASMEMKETLKHKNSDSNLILMHPIQTFSDANSGKESFKGIYFTVEYSDSIAFIVEFCDTFECNYIVVSQQFNRISYHLSCLIASNFLVIMIKMASDMINNSGLSDENVEHYLYPIIDKTIMNIKKNGICESLTGPAMRGDYNVIRKHIESINDDDLKEIYKLVMKKNLELIKDKNIENYEEMESLINGK